MSAQCRTDSAILGAAGGSSAYQQPGFSICDASIGIARHTWTAQRYRTNRSNTRADRCSSYSQFVKASTIHVPRMIGVKPGYAFGGAKSAQGSMAEHA